jgi:hypothetical protein
MNRRKFVELGSVIIPGLMTSRKIKSNYLLSLLDESLAISSPKQLGNDFKWGVASSAFQSEGAFLEDGKGLSIWDEFSTIKGSIRDGSNARQAVDFYHRYPEDLKSVSNMAQAV